jgi:hypothetical protein
MRLLNSILTVVFAATLAGCKDSTSPGTNGGDTSPSTKPWANGPLTISATGAVGPVPDRWTAEIAVDGNVAYTTTWSFRTVNGVNVLGNAIKIWNTAGAAPVLVDSIILPDVGTTSDVQLSDDKTLLVVSTEQRTTGSIVIYNRANPLKLVQIKRYQSGNTLRGVHTVKLGTVNNRNYAFLDIDPSGGLPAQLVVLDITDPQNPVELLARPMGNPYVHDVFFRDGLLYAGLWDDGVTIFDLTGTVKTGSSPSNPIQIGNVRTAASVDGIAKTPDVHNIYWYKDPTTSSTKYAFVGQEGPGLPFSSSSGDIHVLDVSDKANPREVAFYAVSGAGVHNFAVNEQDGILYAAYYNAGVRALDIRGDLGTCTDAEKEKVTDPTKTARCDLRLMKREAGVWTPPTPGYIWGVALVGTKLYASDMVNGIWKLDVSNIHP